MDQGYKHFSHLHNLIMHQMPEGVEVQCFGCHSTATETVYVCWQCNFFLHDQCYRATRSLKHPSHPRHPLTLVPYPTYHSNSFYCNSCQIIGTGFSYSCADCEFDLHVQCAYSISRATSFKNSHMFQELVPQAWINSGHESLPLPFAGVQNHYNDYMHTSGHDLASVSIPHNNQNSTTNAHDPFKPHDLASVSIPTNYPQNTIPFTHDPSLHQDRPSDSIPTNSQNRISSVQYPSISETGPSVSIPASYPQNLVPSNQERPSDSIPTSSHDRISSFQYPSASQTGPSASIPASYPQNPDPSNQERPSDSIPTSSHDQISGVQYPSISETGPSASIPTSYPQNPVPSNQDPSMHQNQPSDSIPTSSQDRISSVQYPSMSQARPSVSIPTSYPQNPTPSNQDPSLHQDRPSDSIPTSSHDQISSFQHPSASQTGPSVSIPASYPQNPTPSNQERPSDSVPTSSHDQISSFQYPSASQTGPSVSIPANHPHNPIPSNQDPSMHQNRPSDSVPTSSQNRFSSVQYPSMSQAGPSVSIPTRPPQNPIPSNQDPSMHQDRPSDSIPTSSQNRISSFQYPSASQSGPSAPQDKPSVSIPTSSHNSSAQQHSIPQNGLKDKETTHFSHPHKLFRVTLQEDEENEVICSGCEETIVGDGYSCNEPDCDFHLHESCVHLKQEIHHKSHPEHPLTLLPKAPYNKNGEFTCSACFSDGTGFTYHCSICKFDLHVPCVNLPETVKRPDHKHALKLFYSCPVKDEDYTFYCDVCHDEAQKDRWVYYCEPCDYGTHLGCVDCEECERDSILDTQAQLQRLQLQMEMARQSAQFMASMGSSLASL